MTPDGAPLLTLRDLTLSGQWGGRVVDGPGALVIHRAEGRLATRADQWALSWRQLGDATLDQGGLHLFHGSDRVSMVGGGGELPRAWGMIVEQACPMPELARGLRSLGTSRGAAEAQARFFAPLLAARRRAAEPDAVERRVALFDGAALARRWTADVAQLAALRHPDDAPRRRGLEAHLEEAIEPCLDALEQLQVASARVFEAPAGTRFVAWRSWTRSLRRVFLAADRTWHHITLHLP